MDELAARVRSAFRLSDSVAPPKPPRIGMVVDISEQTAMAGFIPSLVERPTYPYSRPEFLFFSEEEIRLTADQSIRPIVSPKYPHNMPLFTGYAEVINSGKTKQNEDQASAKLISLSQTERVELTNQSKESPPSKEEDDEDILSPTVSSPRYSLSAGGEAALFILLDGHAGTGAAVMASQHLHKHIKQRLCEVLETVINYDRMEWFSSFETRPSIDSCEITGDELVKGALERAFVEMDEKIAREKQAWRLPGGAAALAVLVFLGKVFIANAGDCRALLSAGGTLEAVSRDMTPRNERKRLQSLVFHSPELLGNYFSRLEYSRHLTKNDLKKKVYYRDFWMSGWSTKTVQEEDLKPPMVSTSFRKQRLLNTIGVTRGFGDHHLITVDEHLSLKPFLSPVPEVQIVDLRKMNAIGDYDFIIMGTDGLWDALTNEKAVAIVEATLKSTQQNDSSRYSMAAQELLAAARGQLQNGRWLKENGDLASCDDITVFVIPLKNCVAPPMSSENDTDDEKLVCMTPE